MSDRAETCSWCDGDSCWVCGYADGREAAWPLNLSANLAAAGMAATLEERLELMYESYTSSIDLLRRHSFADSWLAIGMAATLVTVLAAHFGQLDDEARRMLGEAVS